MYHPLDSYFPPAVRFSACFALAIVTHLILYIILNDVRLPHITDKTVLPSVRLIHLTPSQQRSAQSASAQNTQEVISTRSKSSHFRATNEQPAPKNITRSNAKKDSTKKAPSEQVSRQTRARKSLKELFAKSKSSRSSINSAKQVSTKDAPLLSDYELALINHIRKASLYDRFHKAMGSQTSVAYTIQLTLLAHGAIKNAKIIDSSGINDIDRLAITAAYNASPYPRPPASDQDAGFSYRIPLVYDASDQSQ